MVAARAGVTVQTVIRHFRSKEELFGKVVWEAAEQESARRAETVPGDVRDAVRTVVAHYERIGDAVLRLLAQEDPHRRGPRVADEGRQIHYQWVERASSPFLPPRTLATRRRRRGQLIVLTDVFAWRLRRRDLGFGRRQTELAMTEMVNALLNGGT